jgi:hypothetical protein
MFVRCLVLSFLPVPLAALASPTLVQGDEEAPPQPILLVRHQVADLVGATSRAYDEEQVWVAAPRLGHYEPATFTGTSVSPGAVLQERIESWPEYWDEFVLDGCFTQELGGDTLLVSATSAFQDRIARELERLRAAARAHARLVIERRRYAPRPGSTSFDVDGGVVTRAERDALLARLGTPQVYVSDTVAARGVESTPFGTRTHTRLLVDQSLDIASNVAALQPEFEDVELVDGGRVVAAAGGDGWHVVLDLDTSRTRPARDVLTRTADFLDTALVSQRCASSFFLPAGDVALIVRWLDDGGLEVVSVSVEGGDPRLVRPLPGGAVLVDGAAALDPRIVAERSDAFGERRRGGPIRGVDGSGGGYLRIGSTGRSIDALADQFGFALARLTGEGAIDLFMAAMGPASASGPLHAAWVLEPDVGSVEPRLAEHLAELTAAFAPLRATCVVRTRLMDGERELGRCDVPLCVGGTAAVLDLCETPRALGVEVEVAQGVASGDLECEPAVEAFSVLFQLVDRGSTGFALVVDGARQTTDVSERATGSLSAPTVQSVATTVLDLVATCEFERGGGVATVGSPLGVHLVVELVPPRR